MEDNQINIVETITQTINNLFSNLFSSIDNSLYSVLDDLLFIDSDVISNNNLKNILGNSNSNGIILICNALLLGFTLYYLCTLLFSYITLSHVQNPLQFIFKLILCSIALNCSDFLLENLIMLFSNISLAIREVGEIIFNESICLTTFINKFNSTIYVENTTLNIFSFNGLIKSFISIGFLNLAISYSIRYVMVKVFIILAPFAIITLINSHTIWVFKSWFKILLSLLILQIFISLILLVAFSFQTTASDSFSKLIYIGCIYSLIKCNTFVKDFMGGLSTDVSLGVSNIKSLFSK